MKHVSDFDAAMKVQNPQLQDMKWLSPFESMFTINGFAWNLENRVFRRMPVNINSYLPDAVDYLASHSAGGQIRFHSTSKRIGIRVTLKKPADMVHMPATGQSGCDLYVKRNDQFIFSTASKYNLKTNLYELLMFSQPESLEQEYILNLPLYEEVVELYIGIDADEQVRAASKRSFSSPIVVYGTSITQGGCASRPGMAHTNIISRALNVELINLGFSGSGRGETNVARCICEIESPALIVLDYEANTRNSVIAETMPGFVDVLRQKHHHVPILVVSAPPNVGAQLKADLKQRAVSENEWQRQFVESRQAAGDRNIYFLDGCSSIEADFMEATVDGVHPTDYGFKLIADLWLPTLRQILKVGPITA